MTKMESTDAVTADTGFVAPPPPFFPPPRTSTCTHAGSRIARAVRSSRMTSVCDAMYGDTCGCRSVARSCHAGPGHENNGDTAGNTNTAKGGPRNAHPQGFRGGSSRSSAGHEAQNTMAQTHNKSIRQLPRRQWRVTWPMIACPRGDVGRRAVPDTPRRHCGRWMLGARSWVARAAVRPSSGGRR